MRCRRRGGATQSVVVALLAAVALTLLASGAVRAAPCPSLGVDSLPDGHVLTTKPGSDSSARLVAPDCTVTDIEVGMDLPTLRPGGRPVFTPVFGPGLLPPAPVQKRTLHIKNQVIARIHRLPSVTNTLSFGACPTFAGGADLTNAPRLNSFILNNCPSIETLDNVQFPESVTYIGVENTSLKSIKNVVWPLSLARLFLRSNKLTSAESNYPESITTLKLEDNPMTKLDRGDLPIRAPSITLPALTSIKGVTWPRVSSFPVDGTTLTEFEIRESDVEKLQNALDSLYEKIKQSACSDPTATLQNVGDNDVCVITDDRFEALYRTSPSVTLAPTVEETPVNATTPTIAPASSRSPSSTSTATGSGSGSGSAGDDLLEDITLPDGQTITRRRKSGTQDDAQDEEGSPSSRTESDGSGDAASDDAAPGKNGGGARRGTSSPSTRLSGSPGGSSKDGGSNDTSSTSSSSSIVRTTIFAAVGALIFFALFVAVCYRRSAQRRKARSDTTESPVFVTLPATPQGSSGDRPDGDPQAPLVGFLANDVRNDESLASFRIVATDIALGKIVARGGFGVVHRGVFRDRDVAVKQMQPGTWRNEAALARFMDEIRLCAKLNHAKIVEFVGISWTSLRDLSVVSEFMGGGDLHDALRTQPAPSRVDWFEPWTAAKLRRKTAIARDVAEAVVYLHSRSSPVLHRDLKARNVLLDEGGHAKLSDFGISREVVVDETLTSEIGTAAWIAPEVLRGERYSQKADVYSFGVLLVELDVCRHPYAAIKETDADGGSEPVASPTAAASHNAFQNANMVLMVSTGKLRPGLSKECPGAIKALAEQCLSFDASDRPSSNEVYERLQNILKE